MHAKNNINIYHLWLYKIILGDFLENDDRDIPEYSSGYD